MMQKTIPFLSLEDLFACDKNGISHLMASTRTAYFASDSSILNNEIWPAESPPMKLKVFVMFVKNLCLVKSVTVRRQIFFTKP